MKIGILGGSGLYDMDGLEDVRPVEVSTPFGAPSDVYVCGRLKGQDVYFLPRHGRGHRLLPSEINHRANIYGFKKLGVECVLSVSAVGSLKENLRPLDIVLPDQYFDRTKASSQHTFFGRGVVAHIAFAEPTCASLRRLLAATAQRVIQAQPGRADVRVQSGGTYVNMEGPAFSTLAESRVYRSFGFDVIGMTSLAEAKLCREAEICYQPMAMVTDYDCWHETEETVTVELIIQRLMANTTLAMQILRELLTDLSGERDCACASALKGAILTRPEAIPEQEKRDLAPIIGQYVGPGK